ncbi:MAG TPA: GntR family transcriptional regulator [Paenibacillus sp.]|nr:GntR family transcriptional regulator [Paenibacillus sp.]
MLNRNDVVPLYAQLQKILKEDIIQGKYREGETIPSETQLMQEYNITRTTIRKAIVNLVNEGLLKTVHGKGTIVSLKEIRYNIWNFSGFTDYFNNKNETPISKVLENQVISENGQDYLKLARARGVQKEQGVVWLTIDTSLVPLSLFPYIEQTDFSKESLYNTMKQKYKITPKNASLQINPILGNELTESVFGYNKSVPLVKATGTVLSEDGIEIERVEVIYGPKMEFKIVTSMD